MKRKEFRVIGELAKATGVSTDTLRHYERKGVLTHTERAMVIANIPKMRLNV